jgi:hypothetical protein
MFLMQIDHDAICEPHSNRLFWKFAKRHTEELCGKIADYKMLGKKETDFKGFQTINYCEKLINDYQQEEVDQYHPGFGKLFKWLTAAIALRKQDIIRRKAICKRDKEAREAKIDEQTQRALNREQHIQECSDKWQVDNGDAIDTFKKYEEIKALQEQGAELDDA